MKKLFKMYNIETVEDYRNIVLDSYLNGQRKQAKEQFKAMPKSEQIDFLKAMIFEYQSQPLAGSIFFFNSIFNL